jgi:hypothetical protein
MPTGTYQKNAEWLSADTDAVASHLRQLVALESDQAVIDVFSKSLKNMENREGPLGKPTLTLRAERPLRR